MADSFYLGAYWKQRSCTLREYIAGSKGFLARLGALHPVFQGLMITGKSPSSEVVLQPDLSNLEELIFRCGPHDDDLFSHANPDGSPSLDSEASHGFMTSYSHAKPWEEEDVGISITAGMASPWLTNAVVIDLPKGVREFREYGFVRKLLETTVDCWAPSMAVVTSSSFREKLGDSGGSRTIGWMTWFSDSLVRKALPKGIDHEPLAGGLLVTTAREAVSLEAPAHVATALQIRDHLVRHGFL